MEPAPEKKKLGASPEELSSSDSESISVAEDAKDDEWKDGDEKLQGLMHSVFQNEVVLEHLFGLCPPKLLFNFRLVSRLWHKESLAPFRSSVLVKLDDGRKLDRFLDFVKDTSNACDSKPYRLFRLERWDFDFNFIYYDEDEERYDKDSFFHLCANSITHLELDQCYCDEDDVKGFRKVVFNSFPNLQTLVLGFRILYSELEPIQQDLEVFYENQPNPKSLTIVLGLENRLPVSWLELFSRFSNLTSLQLKSADEDEEDDDENDEFDEMQLEEMLSAMKIIRTKDKSKLALKHLDIFHASREPQIELSPRVGLLFRELELPLESLALDLGHETELDVVRNILEVHGKTLKRLTAHRHIDVHQIEDYSFLQRDQHGNLQDIRVSENFFENSTFRKLIYKCCPNLQTLNLDGHSLTNKNGFVMQVDPYLMEHPNIKSLLVDLYSGSWDPLPVPWLELLSQFPNLVSLTLKSVKDREDVDCMVVDMLTAVQTIRREDSRKLQLKQLDISALRVSDDEDEVLLSTISALFREIQLPLEFLSMDFGDKVGSYAIHEILKVHRKTLKSLTAFTCNRPNSTFPTGRQLDNLEELRISDNFFENLTFHNMVYECCPKLRTLEVDGYRLHNESGPVMQVDPYVMEHPTMKSLAIELCWDSTGVSWVELLSRFPNLAILKLENGGNLDTACRTILEIFRAMQTIWETDKLNFQLRNLDLLRLDKSGLSDGGLTPTIGLLLKELKPPLESLIVDFRSTESKLIKDILQTHGKTLKNLTACRDPKSSPYDMKHSACRQLNSLEELTISENFFGIVDFRQLVYEWCPNLQTLVVDDYRLGRNDQPVQQSEEEYGGFYYWEHPNIKSLTVNVGNVQPMESSLEVLSHFPGLISLNLQFSDCTEGNISYKIGRMLRAVEIIRGEDKSKLAFQHLNIVREHQVVQTVVPLPPSVVFSISELQLPLQSLAIDLGRGTEPGVFKDILMTYAKSLKSLTAFWDPNPNSSPDKEFPFGVRLEELQELTISANVSDNLNFVDFAPNLVKLHVGDEPSRHPTAIVRNTRKLTSLPETNLRELLLSQPVGMEDLLQLTEWIPNLVRLSMHLDDEQFRIVCKSWRNLQHLRVFGYKLTDEGVTGMKYCNPQPNITWLENLTSFAMDDKDFYLENLLTDVSAFYGFLQLGSLQSLKLCCQISKIVKLGLEGKLQDCTITDAGNDIFCGISLSESV